MFSFLRTLPYILFSFFLSSLVWNQLRSGSWFCASFPFSRSRFAVLICGDSKRLPAMEPLSDNVERGSCRKPLSANAWGSGDLFADTDFRGADAVCLLSGAGDQGPPHSLTWASDCCISLSSASSCRTEYTSFSIFSILSRNFRMTS